MADTKKKAPAKKTAPKSIRIKKDAVSQEPAVYYCAVGRRKEAIARIRLQAGTGTFNVNEKSVEQYFPSYELLQSACSPLVQTNTRETLDVSAKVVGGGFRGQAEAVRHGIARALLLVNPDYRKTLRSLGYLTRDPRIKERKKPGLKRARRAPQFSKR